MASLKHVLSQPSIVTVLAIVLGFNVAIEFEWVQRNLPFIRSGQLSVHRFLCSLSPRSVTPKWVRSVEIDDAAHAQLGEPTNRAFLAKLVSQAVAGDAAVVVLDLKLLAPDGMPAGKDEEKRAADNDLLLAAVRDAADKGVPVILASWLKLSANGAVARPGIFVDSTLPLPRRDGLCDAAQASPTQGSRRRMCVRIGNINLPTDKRRVPLLTPRTDPQQPSESLALAAVQAYEDAFDRKPRTVEKTSIVSALNEREFPFASFIPEAAFQTIPIVPLANGVADAVRMCRGRIIVVGGTWHADLGQGEAVDAYETPVGDMRGLYLHANYIEALLDDRYARELPVWMALVFDFAIGTWLYVRFHRARRGWAQLRLLVIPAGLLAASYITFSNLNVYLDFILPLSACFVHLAVEYARDYIHLRRSRDPRAGMAVEVS